MNRRAFLGAIAAGLAAVIDPERLLWVPRRKLISIPAPRALSLNMDEFAMRYLDPAVRRICDDMDRAILYGSMWPGPSSASRAAYFDPTESEGWIDL